jgi:hypothetical protein
MENFGIFYFHLVYFTAIGNNLWPFSTFCGHLEYFVVIWYILWSFGIFCGHLVIFPRFGIFYQEESGSPAAQPKPMNEIAASLAFQLFGHIGFQIFLYAPKRVAS